MVIERVYLWLHIEFLKNIEMITRNRNNDISLARSIILLLHNIMNRFFFWVLLVISIILLSLQGKYDKFNNYILDSLLYISYPVEVLSIKLEQYVTNISNFTNAYRENAELKEEVKNLHLLLQDYELVKLENLHLKKISAFISDKNFVYKTARIILSSSGPYVRTGVISGGKADNIRKNQIVVSDMGVVGRVVEVGENSSKILFINDFNSRIPIVTVSSNKKGVLVGNNSNILEILYLDNISGVRVGELVKTSGEGELYPSGLALGRIISVERNNVKVLPFVDIYKLEFVSVLIGRKKLGWKKVK